MISLPSVSVRPAERLTFLSERLGLCNSGERSFELFLQTSGDPPEIFWPIVLKWWSACDGLWPHRKFILEQFRFAQKKRPAYDFFDAQQLAFMDQLPERITVYRGCGRRRVRACPWTTDIAVAEKFAGGGRFRTPPDPVVATAPVQKEDIFFVSLNRDESEIVLDPYRITGLRLRSVEPRGAAADAA